MTTVNVVNEEAPQTILKRQSHNAAMVPLPCGYSSFTSLFSCKKHKKTNSKSLTLPVAPRPFSRIRFDPADLQARAVPPIGALTWITENFQQGAEIKAVNIDGPGDPLCEIGYTLETLELIRDKYPDIVLSLTTLGLHADKVNSLAAAGLTSVTLLVDAVDQKVAEKLYAWIRPDRKTVPITEAAALLMKEQSRAAKAFKAAGCKVTIRTTIYPGLNDDHVADIAQTMAGCGAETMILAPYRVLTSHEEQILTPPSLETMTSLQKITSEYLPTSLIAEKKEGHIGVGSPSSQPKPTKTQPNVAVISSNGMEVDLHLGQACQVLIYGPREDGLNCLLGSRPVPEPGCGSSRWQELAESISDCFAILATSAGENPKRILGQHGITVLITDSEIEGSVDLLFGGGKRKK